MGRHGKPAAKEPPDSSRKRIRSARALARRLWHLLPEEWRGWVWVRRQRWRAWQDRRHTPKGAWDADLPRDPSCWLDGYDIGSYGVAAHLRSHLRRRGDLLPEHHSQEST